jgi:hypothetical protein
MSTYDVLAPIAFFIFGASARPLINLIPEPPCIHPEQSEGDAVRELGYDDRYYVNRL